MHRCQNAPIYSLVMSCLYDLMISDGVRHSSLLWRMSDIPRRLLLRVIIPTLIPRLIPRNVKIFHPEMNTVRPPEVQNPQGVQVSLQSGILLDTHDLS